MSLTFAHGPLSKKSASSNFGIDGPPHRLFFDDFPRRVRAVFGGQTVLDTRRGKLLHETGLLPQLYVPWQDLRTELLAPCDHQTHCPFKGNASYWTLVCGERCSERACWAYPEPRESAEWLTGYAAFYWRAVDAWFDEDEEVHGHLRDPYHRVDVRPTSDRVRVLVDRADGRVIADTHRAKVLSETGLPNRLYVPFEDVDPALLEPSSTHTVCPYKGTASYRNLWIEGRRFADAAWYYPHPLEDAMRVKDHLCFDAEGIVVEVDGERLSIDDGPSP